MNCYFLLLFLSRLLDGALLSTAAASIVHRYTHNAECYKDWNQLKVDIEQGVVDSAGVLELCPNTTFHLDEKQNDHWITLRGPQSNDLVIQCGPQGHSRDNCVLDGGIHHFWMDHELRNILIRGVTFQNAKHGSIWHACCGVQNVNYEDCIWRDNHHVHLPTSNTAADGGGAAISGYNADLSFRNCTFLVRIRTTCLDHGKAPK